MHKRQSVTRPYETQNCYKRPVPVENALPQFTVASLMTQSFHRYLKYSLLSVSFTAMNRFCRSVRLPLITSNIAAKANRFKRLFSVNYMSSRLGLCNSILETGFEQEPNHAFNFLSLSRTGIPTSDVES